MSNQLKYNGEKDVFITDIRHIRALTDEDRERYAADTGRDDGDEFHAIIELKDKSTVYSKRSIEEIGQQVPLVNIGKAKNGAQRMIVATNVKRFEPWTRPKDDKGYDLSRQFKSKTIFYGDIRPILNLGTKPQMDDRHAKAICASAPRAAAE